MEDVRGTLLERDQRVERRDAVRLCRRDLEPAARVAERALGHPADAALRGAQRGEEQVAPRAVAARDASVVDARRADDCVDRLALGLRRLGASSRRRSGT